MDYRRIFLLVALIGLMGVAVIDSAEVPVTPSEPETPVKIYNWGTCNKTEEENIKGKLDAAMKCFTDLIFPTNETSSTCMNINSVEILLNDSVEPAKCFYTSNDKDQKVAKQFAKNSKDRFEKNKLVIFKMMNTTYKYNGTILKTKVCWTEKKQDLKKCVKDYVPSQNVVHDSNEHIDLFYLVKNLDLNNTASEAKADSVVKCVKQIWERDANCTGLAPYIDELLANVKSVNVESVNVESVNVKSDEYINNGVFITINFSLMIGTTLLALYW